MADKDPALDTISDEGKGIESGSEQQTKAARRSFLSHKLYLRILVLILVRVSPPVFSSSAWAL
jgi:hypothetical protein